MVRLGERTSVSYSLSTETRSRNTAFTASCQDQTDSGKYDSGRKSAFSTSAGKCCPPSGKRHSLHVRSATAWWVMDRRPARCCAPPRIRAFMTDARCRSRNPRLASALRRFHPIRHAKPRCKASAPTDEAGIVDAVAQAGDDKRLHRHAGGAQRWPRRRGSGRPAPPRPPRHAPAAPARGARSSAARASGAISAPENARMARGGDGAAQAGEQRQSSRPG